MADPRCILDTGPLVAYANASDKHHSWSVKVLDALGAPPVTCEIVLAEACHLLSPSRRAVELILGLPGQGRVLVEPVLGSTSDGVRAAVTKYWPIMDVADGCVVQLAGQYPRARIVTTDLRDFTIYRRPGGQSFELVHP